MLGGLGPSCTDIAVLSRSILSVHGGETRAWRGHRGAWGAQIYVILNPHPSTSCPQDTRFQWRNITLDPQSFLNPLRTLGVYFSLSINL